MVGIVGVIASLTVLGLSLVITRIATTALSLTGLSWEAAKFQARSAFTGTGFTTSEAERVVDHPVRRRVIVYRGTEGRRDRGTEGQRDGGTEGQRDRGGIVKYRLATVEIRDRPYFFWLICGL